MKFPAMRAMGWPVRGWPVRETAELRPQGGGSARDAAVAALVGRRHFRAIEVLPWVVGIAVFYLRPDDLQLGAQVLAMILFAMSLDLVLGYTGVVTLGHAAFFGMGAYAAGLISVAGWTEPITGLLVATVAAGILGLVTGAVILRTSGLALLMLSMAITLLLYEIANHFNGLTGGDDGLQGVTVAPVLGLFAFDLTSQTAYLYALGVLFVAWLVMRHIVHTPFGRSLVGIRENPKRMEAIGVSVLRRRLAAFTISTAMAGLAGGLTTQINQFASLDEISFDLSGTVVLTLVLGGPGRLYGAFVGATILMVAQDRLAKENPMFWRFWLGLFVIALVLFVRGGVLGIIDTAWARLRRKTA
jgi:branched-chain amino acid transport system permease protein